MKGLPRLGRYRAMQRRADVGVFTGVEESDRFNNSSQLPQKRTFIFLLLVTCVVLVGMAILLWWVPYVGLANIHPNLPIILAVVFGGLVLFGFGGALTLVFTIIRGKNLFFNRRIRGGVIRILFPILVSVGRFLGISKDEVRRSFIAINNQLVLAEAGKVKPEKLLILLPHCLQNHECSVRITGDVDNCKACGKCKIKDLVALSDKHHVSMSVATGGTLARRIVVEKQPEVIIGVACERDLTSGIQDSYPTPVFGIMNQRPFGPCYDTDVDLELVEKGMTTFLGCEVNDAEGSGPVSAKQS
ncbi:MAG: DUF116 domain-containing protein [Thermodesulfobacteriota bacterium]|nr:DUF116 domain-containing protein [Thermodesulfobacteriota bacterium]